MRPAAVLDVQVDLLRWLKSSIGKQYTEYFIESLRNGRSWKVPSSYWQWLWADECRTLDTATTYWASEGVVGITSNASKTMPDEKLRADDLPSKSGFVWFDRPLYMVDIHGYVAAVRIVTWSPVYGTTVDDASGESDGSRRPGVMLRMYTDNHDPIDVQMTEDAEKLSKMGRLDVMHQYSLYHFVVWEFGQSAEWFLGQSAYNEDGTPFEYGPADNLPAAQASMMEAAKWLQTFWAFCRQRIVLQHTQRADRPTAKRFVRASSRDDPDVQVVTLRREQAESSSRESSDDSDVMWTHRWVVDGHWRNQWYPSLGEHRAKYIAPYVKGPEDRPLIVKDKVYKVVR